MSTVLKINASLFAANGQSSQLAERFVAAWQASHPGARVVLTGSGFAGFFLANFFAMSRCMSELIAAPRRGRSRG